MTEIKLQMLCQFCDLSDSVISVIFWNAYQDCLFVCLYASPGCKYDVLFDKPQNFSRLTELQSPYRNLVA